MHKLLSTLCLLFDFAHIWLHYHFIISIQQVMEYIYSWALLLHHLLTRQALFQTMALLLQLLLVIVRVDFCAYFADRTQ